jgi:hypothetical protein
MSEQSTLDRFFAIVRRVFMSVGDALVRLGPAASWVFRGTGRILEFGWRWILRILLVGFVLLPTAIILSLLLTDTWTPDTHVAAMTLWVALSIAVAGGAWAILWVLLRLFLRLVRSPSLGSGIAPRLIALLVVFALFPKIFTPTVGGIAWGVFQFGLATPINLMRLSGNALQDPEPVNEIGPPRLAVPQSQSLNSYDDTFVLFVFERFIRALDRTVSPVVAVLPQFVPFGDLAVAVVVWFLLSLLGREVIAHKLLSHAIPPLRVVATGLTQLANGIGQHPSLNWSNTGFLLILTTGTFLSMAAITSLPRLRESSQPNSDVNADSLKRDLAELQLTEDQIAGYYGKDTPTEIVTLQSVLPGDDDAPGDEGNNTDGPSASGVSSSSEGRATESATVAKKTEVAANDASKRGETASTEKRDNAQNSKVVAATGAKASKKDGTNSASALAAAKAILVATTTELERAVSQYSAVQWSPENNEKVRDLERNLDSARRSQARAREEVEIESEHLRLIGIVEEQGNRLREAWSGLVLRSQSLKEFVHSDGAQSLSSAVREYSVQNIERHGSREEVAHFLRLRNWYAEKTNSHREALIECGRLLRLGPTTGATWMSAMRRALVKPDNLPDGFRRSNDVFEQTQDATGAFTAEVCAIPVSMPIPQPPPLGDSLGPLRFIAGWLLNAASVPLALIVGLVGFGLLGAAISTFVREQLEARLMPVQGTSHVIVSDLAGVALRGISAAIVVFLAVQGGLAVLSGASSDPNPYVLLLACFVAAVFSERVWRKAYDYLQIQLAQDGDRSRVEVIEAKPLALPQESKPTD